MTMLGCSTPWVTKTVPSEVYCPNAAMEECNNLMQAMPGMDPRDLAADWKIQYMACKLQNTLKKECIVEHNTRAQKQGAK